MKNNTLNSLSLLALTGLVSFTIIFSSLLCFSVYLEAEDHKTRREIGELIRSAIVDSARILKQNTK